MFAKWLAWKKISRFARATALPFTANKNRQANKWRTYERHLFALFALSKSAAISMSLRFPPPNEFISHTDTHTHSIEMNTFLLFSEHNTHRFHCEIWIRNIAKEPKHRNTFVHFPESYFEKVSLFLRLKLFWLPNLFLHSRKMHNICNYIHLFWLNFVTWNTNVNASLKIKFTCTLNTLPAKEKKTFETFKLIFFLCRIDRWIHY